MADQSDKRSVPGFPPPPFPKAGVSGSPIQSAVTAKTVHAAQIPPAPSPPAPKPPGSLPLPPPPPKPQPPQPPQRPKPLNTGRVVSSSGRSNTICYYGPTGSGKTTNIALAARWIWKTRGKKTRLIGLDNGGWGSIQKYVLAGLVEPLKLTAVEGRAIYNLRKVISDGWWEKDGRLQKVTDWDEYGLVALDSVTSLGDMIMEDLVSSGDKVAQDIVALIEMEGEGGDVEKFGSPSLSHYGAVQREVLMLLRDFNALPPEFKILTAVESKGEDDLLGTKVITYGPALIGKKLTARIGKDIGMLLHLRVENPSSGDKVVHCHFEQYPDPQTKIPWPAKSRLPLDDLKAAVKRFGGMSFVMEKDEEKGGIIPWLEFLEGLEQKGAEDVRAWMERNKGGK